MDKGRTSSGSVASAMVVASMLASCGADGYDQVQTDEDVVVGEIRQPSTEHTVDKPAAAAIARVTSGVEELWVFACRSQDGTSKIMRRIKEDYLNQPDNPWSAWQTIASTKTCQEAPTVGKWAGETPAETILLYWRDKNNDLIEVRFKPNGSTSTTNLSSTQGIGKLHAPPVVAQTSNTTGAIQAVSIAFERKTTRELFTLDFKGGAWTLRAIRKSSGAQAVGGFTRRFIASYSSAPGLGFPKPMLSHSVNDSDMVFTRSFWTRDFTEYAKVVDPGFGDATYCGLLSFGGSASESDGPCAGMGCAMVTKCAGGNDTSLQKANLSNTGNITIKLAGFSIGGPDIGQVTINSVPDGHAHSFPIGVAPAFRSGTLMGVSYTAPYDRFGISQSVLASAPILANSANRQIFFATSGCSLQYVDFQSFFNFGEVDLGTIVCP